VLALFGGWSTLASGWSTLASGWSTLASGWFTFRLGLVYFGLGLVYFGQIGASLVPNRYQIVCVLCRRRVGFIGPELS